MSIATLKKQLNSLKVAVTQKHVQILLEKSFYSKPVFGQWITQLSVFYPKPFLLRTFQFSESKPMGKVRRSLCRRKWNGDVVCIHGDLLLNPLL